MLIRTILASVTISLTLGCSISGDQRSTVGVNAATPTVAAAQPTQSPIKQLTPQEIAGVCERLPEIKRVPLDGERGRDEVFDAFMNAGDLILPCLIDKVVDPTEIRSPFEFPRWAGYEIRRGDVAFFLILYMKDLAADRFLPENLKTAYQTEGNYTYFKYVHSQKNRRELQETLRHWYREMHQ